MAIWAILAAPLIMSHDLRSVRPEFRDILLNYEAIQIDQDPLGIQGRRVYKVSLSSLTYRNSFFHKSFILAGKLSRNLDETYSTGRRRS